MPTRYLTDFETVAASQTDQILGAVGAKGDIVHTLVCKVVTAATSTVDLQDGDGTAFNVLAANTPVGTFVIRFGRDGIRCVNATTPGWKVTTGAGVSVVAVGAFT